MSVGDPHVPDPRLAEADATLLGAPGRPPNPYMAASVYEALAREGSAPAALRVAVLAAGGLGRGQSWREALALTARAAELGDDLARRQLALLARTTHSAQVDWARLASEIDLAPLFQPPPPEPLTDRARVVALRGFVPEGFGQWIIDRARDRLTPSLVNDAASGQMRAHPMRTAMTCAFGPFDRDLITCIMQERAARASGLPVNQHEAPNVISYEPGQKFGPHVDFVDPANPAFEPELRIIGQRVTTLVSYLNDDFTGAATHFPVLGVTFRGAAGDAVMFSNVLPNGAPDRSTVHAGAPPESGRKWVLSQWIRGVPQLIR